MSWFWGAMQVAAPSVSDRYRDSARSQLPSQIQLHRSRVQSMLVDWNVHEELQHLLRIIHVGSCLVDAVGVAAIVAGPAMAKTLHHAVLERLVSPGAASTVPPACGGAAQLCLDCTACALSES